MMPLLEVRMTSGRLLKWLVADGDFVVVRQSLFYVETDDWTMEVESFYSGVITLTATENEVYDVGAELGSIEVTEENRLEHEIIGLQLNFSQRNYIDSVRGDVDRRTWIHQKVRELFEAETNRSEQSVPPKSDRAGG